MYKIFHSQRVVGLNDIITKQSDLRHYARKLEVTNCKIYFLLNF